MATVARRPTAIMICLAIAVSNCATAGSRGLSAAPQVDRAVLVEYVRALPVGSAVRVQRSDGHIVRGTLMKATDQSLVIQPRVRVPEPPIEIALADVAAVTPDTGSRTGLAKAIGIGVAAGAGAALAVLAIFAAIYSD